MPNLQIELAKVQNASRKLIKLSEKQINNVLNDVADAILENSAHLLEENKKDLEKMDLNDPKYDRLLLNQERLEAIASDIRNVAGLPSPLGKILEEKTLPNGLELSKVTVPLGVIGIIYEARPNVTYDVFALCFKSGNACVLKGGSDANFSNLAGIELINKVLEKHDIPVDAAFLMSNDREEVKEMMQSDEYIDVIIPRGSQGLINFVRENSKVPVIETGAGICHTYFDKSGDLEMGTKIVENAKTRRVSVCNALDCLVVHSDRLPDLPELVKPLGSHSVEIFADGRAFEILENEYPAELLQKADEGSFGTEFLSLKMSIKTVDSLEEAIEHITKYSSKHSEAIIAENKGAVEEFLKNIDASTVYANTSTAFTDGAQFGLGAEIGISTQKLHARGPMSIGELTSYKWIVRGDGQVRPK
ncbi:glutamate-5-semialdehyde dehydrogenase [Patescibacteria group bacterium]